MAPRTAHEAYLLRRTLAASPAFSPSLAALARLSAQLERAPFASPALPNALAAQALLLLLNRELPARNEESLPEVRAPEWEEVRAVMEREWGAEEGEDAERVRTGACGVRLVLRAVAEETAREAEGAFGAPVLEQRRVEPQQQPQQQQQEPTPPTDEQLQLKPKVEAEMDFDAAAEEELETGSRRARAHSPTLTEQAKRSQESVEQKPKLDSPVKNPQPAASDSVAARSTTPRKTPGPTTSFLQRATATSASAGTAASSTSALPAQTKHSRAPPASTTHASASSTHPAPYSPAAAAAVAGPGPRTTAAAAAASKRKRAVSPSSPRVDQLKGTKRSRLASPVLVDGGTERESRRKDKGKEKQKERHKEVEVLVLDSSHDEDEEVEVLLGRREEVKEEQEGEDRQGSENELSDFDPEYVRDDDPDDDDYTPGSPAASSERRGAVYLFSTGQAQTVDLIRRAYSIPASVRLDPPPGLVVPNPETTNLSFTRTQIGGNRYASYNPGTAGGVYTASSNTLTPQLTLNTIGTVRALSSSLSGETESEAIAPFQPLVFVSNDIKCAELLDALRAKPELGKHTPGINVLVAEGKGRRWKCKNGKAPPNRWIYKGRYELAWDGTADGEGAVLDPPPSTAQNDEQGAAGGSGGGAPLDLLPPELRRVFLAHASDSKSKQGGPSWDGVVLPSWGFRGKNLAQAKKELARVQKGEEQGESRRLRFVVLRAVGWDTACWKVWEGRRVSGGKEGKKGKGK
ncbi:hypothetical protein JCM10207_001330 [Rhodosporidiobolus poonsookiae]